MTPTDTYSGTPPLRIGLVGLSASGGWAARAHVPAIAAVHGVTLTALAASSTHSAQAAADAFTVRNAFSNVTDLARCEEVDLVVVAVKVPLHRSLLLPALAEGKPVFCEWPLARDLDEAGTLITAAADIPSFVGLQGRASPALRYLRDLVADGYVGTVLSTSLVASGAHWGQPVTNESQYALDRNQGATMLTIPFGHTIDAMSMVLGQITEVSATTGTRRQSLLNTDTGIQVPLTAEDQVAVTGQIGDGAVLSAHYRAGVSRGTNFLWEINGTDGDLRVVAASGSLQIGPITILGGRGDERTLSELAVPPSYDPFPNISGRAAHGVAHAYAQIAHDVATGTRTVPNFAHAGELHLLLDEIQRSAADGTVRHLAPVSSEA